MRHLLESSQLEKLDQWIEEQNKQMIKNQKQNIGEDNPHYPTYKSSWDRGFPYSGACGGAITYMFTPTTLGTIVKVRYFDRSEIDLTTYDWW